jgi:glycosyltransferase involved in cell wall biosynthesis
MSKKVLFITSSMSKGGAETQLIKVALFLKSHNYQVLTISLKPINEFEIDFEKEGIPVLFLKNWSKHPLNNLQLLFKTIREFKPDIVIAFMFIAIIFARLFKMLLKFKLISSVRIAVLPTKWYLPYILTSGLDDIIVYNSMASKINFEKNFFIEKNGIVINNGIYVPELNILPTVSTKPEEFVWVCLAHFRWNKDYNTLFKAIALLKHLNFRVDIVGEYTDQNNPFRVVKEFNIESHVNIMGFKQHATQYLNNADAFVLSSFSEGMPNALLEAMAFSKPVVVSNIDCNVEILNASGCGFLFKKSDEYDLAIKMMDMMSMSSPERNTMGLRGRNYIQKHFAEARVMENWLTIINQYSGNRELILSK